MLIAQLTDTHITRPGRRRALVTDTARYLARCIDAVNRLRPRPDVAVLTGDLTERGACEEYARLRGLLDALAVPWYVVPGNHDDRARFRATFADRADLPAGGAPIEYVVDDFPVRLIGVDSTSPGHAGGAISAASLAWLNARLAEGRHRPTLLFMHHPPFRTGVRYLDALGFRGVDQLATIVRAHPQIRQIVSGHVHCVRQARWNGVVASTSLSTAPQLVPELFERRPLWLRLEPPGFALHLWRGPHEIVSRTLVLADGGIALRAPTPPRRRANPAGDVSAF
jgi:3',5'-cyclic-AMP phosphodiesterase